MRCQLSSGISQKDIMRCMTLPFSSSEPLKLFWMSSSALVQNAMPSVGEAVSPGLPEANASPKRKKTLPCSIIFSIKFLEASGAAGASAFHQLSSALSQGLVSWPMPPCEPIALRLISVQLSQYLRCRSIQLSLKKVSLLMVLPSFGLLCSTR